jgi:ketosteroid isomerase-like protein
MSQANADLVRDLHAAFVRGDVSALLTMLDDQIEWHTRLNLPHGGDFRG